ncbi:restriction endonuclease subunit S [Acinetobacter johnsonii]|uniref:restriction endonuclease subunit S n=1 Tax=Acinetobacter johnsonii TaxID=40214 RepID=UPI0030FC7577
MEKQKCPEVRFKGFSNDWESSNFLENIRSITDFRGRTPKKLGMDWSKNGYLALSALNVKNGYIDPSIDAHYGDEKLYQKWMSGNELRKGQVLFTTEAPMGNVAQVPDDAGYILSQRTIAFNTEKNKISDNFLAVLLGSPNVFNRLSELCSGGTAKGVSQKSLSTLEVIFPTELNEQECIGNFFQNLDQSIVLQEKKLTQTQNLKKAMLEKMFPKARSKQPEIRLKGFSGDWDVDIIGNVLQEVFRPINLDNETKYRLVTVKRRNGGIAERAILKGKDILVKSQFEVKAGDYVISKRQVVHGATGLVPHELDGSIVSNEYLVGQGTDKLNIEFFALLSTLPEMYKKFFLSSYGVDIEKLFFDVSDWKKREISLPVLVQT